jgi:integrase
MIDRLRLIELKEVPSPRGVRHVPNPYSRDELKVLWAVLEERWPLTEEKWVDRWIDGRTPWRRVRVHAERLQYEAIIACALYGGLRRNEIFRLELDDLHSDHCALPARSRKNPDGVWVMRKVPIIEPMREAFDAWYRVREALQPHVTADPEAPWVRLHQFADFGIRLNEGSRSSEGELHLLRIHGRDYKGKLRWGFHRLRHTCATEMLRSDYKLHVVQQILGHASLQQTLRYAELLESDVLRESDRVGARFARAIAHTRNGHGPTP